MVQGLGLRVVTVRSSIFRFLSGSRMVHATIIYNQLPMFLDLSRLPPIEGLKSKVCHPQSKAYAQRRALATEVASSSFGLGCLRSGFRDLGFRVQGSFRVRDFCRGHQYPEP